MNGDFPLDSQILYHKSPEDQKQPNLTENLIDQNMKFLDIELSRLNRKIIKSAKSSKSMTSNNPILQNNQIYNNKDTPRTQRIKNAESLSIDKNVKSTGNQREMYNIRVASEEKNFPKEMRKSNYSQQDVWFLGNNDKNELFVKSARTENNNKPS